MGQFYHRNNHTEESRVKRTFGNSIPLLGTKILDAGCSRGKTTCEISDLFPNSIVIGIDNQPEVINEAILQNQKSLSKRKIEFRIGDFYNLANGEKYDSIFMMNNLYYCLFDDRMSNDQIGSIINGVKLSLTEKGYFLVSSPANFVIYQKSNESLEKINESEKWYKNPRFQRLHEIIDH
ncbi:class I SAM-dependent methyltransferase [Candidatus Woesearchaeota archaeon]|nr:class I SAM-dependent methyltransferase [Candidatus Woesearchaeota archaeon]